MNTVPFLSVSADDLLREVIRLIQLPREMRLKAVRRVANLRSNLQNPTNPYSGYQPLVYIQGSVRIGAAISAVGRDDQFDVDTMVERIVRRNLDPDQQISELLVAIGPLGDRKEKKSRCAQVQWTDMHIDATPSVLATEWPPRSSEIYDRKGTAPNEKWPIANPEGFALWVLNQVGEQYAQAVEQFYSQPDKFEFPEERPNAIYSLQLTKRFRNVRYEHRDEERDAKRPPSVLLSYFAGNAADPRLGLVEQTIAISREMVAEIRKADATGKKLVQANPMCDADLLTDRWPRNLHDQRVWVEELELLAANLTELVSAPLTRKLEILKALFGERVSSRAFESYRQRVGQAAESGTIGILPTGGIVAAPTILTSAASAAPMTVSRHFGSPGNRDEFS